MAYAFIDLRSLRGLQPKQVSWCQIYRAGLKLSRSSFFKGRVHGSHFQNDIQRHGIELMSNLQLPDVLDLVYKHPLFQQKIYETQVSRSNKVSFSGCFLLLTTHLEHLVDGMLPRQMERPSLFDWKDRATRAVLQPTRWGTPCCKHQATPLAPSRTVKDFFSKS